MGKHLSLSPKIEEKKIKLIFQPEKENPDLFLNIQKLLTSIRQDPEIIYKIYENATTDSITNTFSNLFMDNFFENILNVNNVEDELLTLLWRALNDEFKHISTIEDYDFFLSDSKFNSLLNGILQKYETRHCFHDIVEIMINEFIIKRKEKWAFEILKIKEYILNFDFDLGGSFIDKELKKQIQKDKNDFYKKYLCLLDYKTLEKYKNECDNEIIKEYCNRQLNQKATKYQFINSSFLIDQMFKDEESELILQYYNVCFMSVKKLLQVVFKKLLDNIPLFPYNIRAVCKMIKILIKKKIPDISIIDTYHFVSKYFFSILNHFLDSYDDEAYIDLFQDQDLFVKIDFAKKFLDKISSGNLFNTENTIFYIPFNWFLIKEFMPMYYDFFEQLTNFEFSPYIQKLTSGEIDLDNYTYDFFNEYPEIQFRYFTFFFTIDNYIEMIETLTKILKKKNNKLDIIDNNKLMDNYKENRLIFNQIMEKDYLINNDKLNKLKELKKKDNITKYYLITNQIYKSDMKKLKDEIDENPNCIFVTNETNIKHDNKLQSQLIIKFENLLSILLFRDNHIQKLNLNNNDTLSILNDSMNFLKTEESSSNDEIKSFWYAQTLIPLIQRFKDYDINLEDIYSEMKIKINKSIELYDRLDTVCSDILNQMKNLKKIESYLKYVMSLVDEIKTNHDIIPIIFSSFPEKVKIEYDNNNDSFAIFVGLNINFDDSKNKNKFISYYKNLDDFLNRFPNIYHYTLDKKEETDIQLIQKLKINDELKKVYDVIDKIIDQFNPNISPCNETMFQIVNTYLNQKNGQIETMKKDMIKKLIKDENIKYNFVKIEKNLKLIISELNRYNTLVEKIKVDRKELIKQKNRLNLKINNYIFEKLHEKIFPKIQSKDDKIIYKRCFELSWIEPKHVFVKKKYLIHDDFFKDIVEYMKRIDIERSPKKKVDACNILVNYVENIIFFNEGNKKSGADERTPFLLYAVIKAKPTKMKTNLEYMKIFFPFGSMHINTIDGIATQLLNNSYKLVNVTEDEIKTNCNVALSTFSEKLNI